MQGWWPSSEINRERKDGKAMGGENKPQLQGLMFLQSF